LRWWLIIPISLDLWIPLLLMLILAKGGSIRERIAWIFLETPSGGLVVSSVALGMVLGVGLILFVAYITEYARDIARALELRSFYNMVSRTGGLGPGIQVEQQAKQVEETPSPSSPGPAPSPSGSSGSGLIISLREESAPGPGPGEEEQPGGD